MPTATLSIGDEGSTAYIVFEIAKLMTLAVVAVSAAKDTAMLAEDGARIIDVRK